MNPSKLLDLARAVLENEADSVRTLSGRLNEGFVQACTFLLQCKGRVVVTGMGKSGHIGNKIAATLASTGTPAHFVHPAEASHGDIGMVTDQDIVIAISNSGTTAEVVSILPILKRKGVSLIALTGNKSSPLAKEANAHLDISVSEEACPLGLAPTTSTTATLVMGDALAMALLEARGFTAEDFAFSHPGGNLGRRLLLKVSDIMHSGDDIPQVVEHTTVKDSLLEMSAKKLGMTTVTNESGKVCGVFTDGDLRRFLDSNHDLNETPIRDVMTSSFRSVGSNSLATEAARIMEDNEIYTLLVIGEDDDFQGIITMHDLLKANVV